MSVPILLDLRLTFAADRLVYGTILAYSAVFRQDDEYD